LIPEIDIWRAALLIIKRHGGKALDESAARAEELALAADDAGAAGWRRIMDAVTQLANKTPLSRVHTPSTETNRSPTKLALRGGKHARRRPQFRRSQRVTTQ
jgi:hypothetical protein